MCELHIVHMICLPVLYHHSELLLLLLAGQPPAAAAAVAAVAVVVAAAAAAAVAAAAVAAVFSIEGSVQTSRCIKTRSKYNENSQYTSTHGKAV